MPPSIEPSLSALAQDWAQGAFHRVYFLAGPDTLTKDDALQKLKKAFLGPDPAGMGLDVFDGNDASAGAILSAVNTLPFFGGRRLVLVRRAAEMATADTNRLADGLASIPASNALVLLWDEKPDARSVLVQAARSAGVVLTLWPPFENQLPGWVIARAESLGKSMDRRAAQALVEQAGPALPDLVQELGKLALYAKDRPALTLADVAAVVGDKSSLRFMEWERALWRKDRARSLSIVEVLRAQGEPAEKLLPQLIRAVQKLCLGKALMSEKNMSKKQVFDRLWIKLQDTQAEFERAVAGWTWNDLLRALDRLVEADVSLKRGRGHPDADLTRAVWALTENDSTLVKRR
ncbi:MAG: DNA polymerase III subunit delta [Elusimicrobia bacterium]|nr:DNA polymerase III subunit delta [Elusimicrobiota bacterium]MBP9127424.1 DNA polymerase III subunit delta [Elusimicrobiota bacterium]MBP9698459.1 DNA polymerase III subunit delta [Elusimicrobiota bacterium]